jgi:type VI protein secretion system component Hcp
MRASAMDLRSVFVVSVVLAAVLAIGLPQANGEIFLKISNGDGTGIDGSYANDPYSGYSKIKGYALSLSLVPDPDNEGSTILQVLPMWITKQLDLASIPIFSAAWLSQPYDYADVYIDSSTTGETDQWNVHWQLRDVSVSSYSTLAGNDLPAGMTAGEKFSLDFASVLYEYQEFDDGGARVGGVSFDSDNGDITVTGAPQNFQFVTQAGVITIPEPSAIVLLSMGAFGLAFHGWRRRK